MFEAFMGIFTGVLIIGAYYIGKFKGIKETFDKLEEEGKIITKDELRDLIK